MPVTSGLLPSNIPLGPNQSTRRNYADDGWEAYDTTVDVTPDSTALVKGKLKLSGDLGGTADLPTVPGLTGKQETLVSGVNIKTINGESVVGSGNIEVSAGSGGYQAHLYLTEDTSTVVGTYKQVSYTPPATETIQTITCNNGETAGLVYLFELPIGITTIDAGPWTAVIQGFVNNAGGTTKIRAETFKRSSSGVETTLFSISSDEINNTTTGTFTGTQTTQSIFTVDPTDRLGLRLFANTTANVNRTVSYIVGDGRAAYFTNPIALRHNQTRGRDLDDCHPISAITDLTSTLSAKALDSAVVHNTGNESVAGNKTFSGVTNFGVASTTNGSVKFNNNSNTNSVIIQSGVTSASYTLTLPTAVAGAGQVLTDVEGNGVLSWTTPSGGGLTWGASITGNSGTGLTTTIGNSASAGTIGQKIVIGNTQTNLTIGQQIVSGAVYSVGLSIIQSGGTQQAGIIPTGISINNYSTATQSSVTFYGIRAGYNFNTNSGQDSRLIDIQNNNNSGSGTNTGIFIDQKSNEYSTSSLYGAGIFGYQSGSAPVLGCVTDKGSATYGVVDVSILATPTTGILAYRASIDNTAYGHIGFLVNGGGSSQSQTAFKADWGTVGTGRAFYAIQNSIEATAEMQLLTKNPTGALSAQVLDTNYTQINRTNSATSGTLTDTYFGHNVSKTVTQSGVGGTFVDSNGASSITLAGNASGGNVTLNGNVQALNLSLTAASGKTITSYSTVQRLNMTTSGAGTITNNSRFFEAIKDGTTQFYIDNSGKMVNPTLTNAVAIRFGDVKTGTGTATGSFLGIEHDGTLQYVPLYTVS